MIIYIMHISSFIITSIDSCSRDLVIQSLMSAQKQVKISELSPTTKGELTLVFQVHQVLERSQEEGKETVTCRVVDESGIITAYFDQFASKFIEGSVFQLKNFRCKVVDHHLRLEMIKTTVVAKHPLKMGFKDLENDLSVKFYVSAAKQAENEKTQKKDQIIKKEGNDPKVEEKKQSTEEKSKKHNHQGDKEKQSEAKKEEKSTKKENVNKETRKQSDKIQQGKKDKKYVQKQETKQNKKDETKKEVKEKETVVKEQEKDAKKPKYVPKCEEILLVDCPKFQELEANFRVRINTQTIAKKENYFMCKVSDSSGSTYFEFHPNMAQKLENKAWYRLIGFKVYKDRDFGFVATQEKHSTYELLAESEQKIDTRLLWK